MKSKRIIPRALFVIVLLAIITCPTVKVGADSGTWTISGTTDDCSKWGVYNGGTFFDVGPLTAYVGYHSATIHDMGSGLRFLAINIPKGSMITSAYLKPYAYESNANVEVNTKIRGEDTDDADAFSSEANFDGRVRTTAFVEWNNIGTWTANVRYTSPDIKTIIQEIISRDGWSSGNDIVIFWDDFDGLSDEVALHTRRFDHRESGSGTYTQLTITWEEIVPPSDPNLLFGAGFNASSPYGELHWNHSLIDVQFFEVQNSSDAESWTYLGQSTTTNYTDNQVFNGTDRYYRVRACNFTYGSWGNSSFSDVNFETVYFVASVEGAGIIQVESDAPWIALAIILSIIAFLLAMRIKR